MPLTPDRRKSAYVGVGLTGFGLTALLVGTLLLPMMGGLLGTVHFAGGVMLSIFGILLSLSSILIFILPAVYDYIEEITD